MANPLKRKIKAVMKMASEAYDCMGDFELTLDSRLCDNRNTYVIDGIVAGVHEPMFFTWIELKELYNFVREL